MLQFREVAVDAPEAHALLEEYFAERIATFPDPAGYTTTHPDPAAFVPPNGVFLVVDDDEQQRSVACGGIRRIDPGPDDATRFEIKHLFVNPHGRGQGLGKALLTDLEERAKGFGAREVVLDTNASLTAAGGLYRSSGYRTIEPYNDNPNATHWYAKAL